MFELSKKVIEFIMLKTLKAGSTIAVIAPAFPPNNKKTKKGIKYLKDKGYNVIEGKSLSGHYGYLSATDEQRAKELNDFFAAPVVAGAR